MIATAMVQAAEEAESYSPPWWSAEVTGVQRRTTEVAVVTLSPC